MIKGNINEMRKGTNPLSEKKRLLLEDKLAKIKKEWNENYENLYRTVNTPNHAIYILKERELTAQEKALMKRLGSYLF